MSLRNAVVVQAVEDYREGFARPDIYTDRIMGATLRDDARRFFESAWCDTLIATLMGRDVLSRLQDETMETIKNERTHKDMNVTLVQAPENPINLIAKIASICYDSKVTNRKGLVKHLYLNGHHSVFEHVHFTWKIEGISRACSHQLVRHRMATITQRSQRYCEENGFDYVTPDSISSSIEALEAYGETMKVINETYCDMVHVQELRKEDARFILPNACTTEMYFSCNLRELIHICNERLCSRAQWEIRKVVQMMAATVCEDLQYMLVPKCQSGYLICNKPCRGKGYVVLGGEKDEEALQ